MHPVLLTLPLPGRDFEVSTYRAALTLALLATVLVAWALARRQGLDSRTSLLAITGSAAALFVGARAWNMATSWDAYANDLGRIFTLEATGYSMFGGVLACAAVGFVLARCLGLDPWKLADAGGPALALGVAIMRAGCFANGCCFGVPSRLPWAITFPAGSSAHFWQIGHDLIGIFDMPLSVHPTQLYELAGALLCGALALALLLRKAPSGVPFLAFVATFSVVRGANWHLRVHSAPVGEGLVMYDYLYIATVLACVLLGVWRYRSSRSAPQRVQA